MLRPNLPIAVDCGVAKILRREGQVSLLPKFSHADVARVARDSVVDRLHEFVGKHFHRTARAGVESVILGAETMGDLFARCIVAHEKRAGSLINVTSLIAHDRTLADVQQICSKSLVTKGIPRKHYT